MERLIEGTVVAHVGKGLAIDSAGQKIVCHTRRQMETAVVGDRVLWEPLGPDQGRVHQVLPRRSVLLRPARNGATRPAAANIDQIFIVFAVKPACDFLLIDQYLAACENHDIDAILLLNKNDLIDKKQHAAFLQELVVYRQLGYRLINTSTVDGHGMDELSGVFKDRVSLFAGQSGVGKTSLTKAFIDEKNLQTGHLTKDERHGRHTTTTARLYHLKTGGDLIDSPGVAIFGLAGLSIRQLAIGFREIEPLSHQCQFHNCRHLDDKGCAVRDAAENNRIAPSRYQRFVRLTAKLASQQRSGNTHSAKKSAS